MLSYQHGFHAGNLADLHKHIVLVALWNTLKRKPRALSYLETHAGRGLYPLDDEFAKKTGEQAEGAGRYFGGALLFDDALTKARFKLGQAIYPGSPALVAGLMGDQDRMILAELHPQEYKALKANMSEMAEIHNRDGYEMALALAPLKPRRGLVLIDPSYEIKAEFDAVPIFVGRLLRKWPQAVIAIWYPLLEGAPHNALTQKLETQGELKSEVRFANSKLRMKGSGMLVLNAPYGAASIVKEELQAVGDLMGS